MVVIVVADYTTAYSWISRIIAIRVHSETIYRKGFDVFTKKATD
jgi:hypothetical protein